MNSSSQMTGMRARPTVRRKWPLRLAALALAAAAGAAFVLTMSADLKEASPLKGGLGEPVPEQAQPSLGSQAGDREGIPAGTRPAQAATVDAPQPVPASHFFGVSTPSGPYNFAELEQFQSAAGRKPAVLMFSQNWAQGPVPRELLDSITERQMLPMITWEPRDSTSVAHANQPEYALSRILDGSWDAYIREWAAGIRDWGRPVALRFGQQMNGNWFPWAEGVNGNQPGQYAEAWKHTRRIFDQVQAANVIWVWSPNVSFTGSTPLAELYPGDDYVDWVGIDGYNGGPDLPWGGWVSPDQLFGATISEVRILTAKPLLLTEVASTESGGDKAAWIGEFLRMVAHHRDVMGFVWVQAAREADWRIDSTETAARSFATGVADSRFGSAALPQRTRAGR